MSSNILKKYIQCLRSDDNVGCCTASAAVLAAEMILSMDKKFIPLSRLYVYYMTRHIQGRSNQKGAELKATLEAMVNFGVAPEKYWPFNGRRVDTEPSMQAKAEAVFYRLISFDFISPIKFKDSIDNEIPIVIGMHTGRLFWKLNGPLQEQAYKPINSTDNRQSKGHAVTIVGYDDEIGDGSWIIANSIGPKWGDHGYGVIPYSCVSNIGEAYILNNFAGSIPGKKISEN